MNTTTKQTKKYRCRDSDPFGYEGFSVMNSNQRVLLVNRTDIGPPSGRHSRFAQVKPEKRSTDLWMVPVYACGSTINQFETKRHNQEGGVYDVEGRVGGMPLFYPISRYVALSRVLFYPANAEE